MAQWQSVWLACKSTRYQSLALPSKYKDSGYMRLRTSCSGALGQLPLFRVGNMGNDGPMRKRKFQGQGELAQPRIMTMQANRKKGGIQIGSSSCNLTPILAQGKCSIPCLLAVATVCPPFPVSHVHLATHLRTWLRIFNNTQEFCNMMIQRLS